MVNNKMLNLLKKDFRLVLLKMGLRIQSLL